MVDGLGGDVEKPYQKLSKEEDIKKIRFPILAMLYLSLCTGWMDGWMASFTPTSPLKGYAGYLYYNYPYISITHEPISYGRTLCLA